MFKESGAIKTDIGKCEKSTGNNQEDLLNPEEKKMLEEIRDCADKISRYWGEAELNNIREHTFKWNYKQFADRLFFVLRDALTNDGMLRGYEYAEELLDNFNDNIEKCVQNKMKNGVSLAELRDKTKELKDVMSSILYSDPVYDE